MSSSLKSRNETASRQLPKEKVRLTKWRRGDSTAKIVLDSSGRCVRRVHQLEEVLKHLREAEDKSSARNRELLSDICRTGDLQNRWRNNESKLQDIKRRFNDGVKRIYPQLSAPQAYGNDIQSSKAGLSVRSAAKLEGGNLPLSGIRDNSSRSSPGMQLRVGGTRNEIYNNYNDSNQFNVNMLGTSTLDDIPNRSQSSLIDADGLKVIPQVLAVSPDGQLVLLPMSYSLPSPNLSNSLFSTVNGTASASVADRHRMHKMAENVSSIQGILQNDDIVSSYAASTPMPDDDNNDDDDASSTSMARNMPHVIARRGRTEENHGIKAGAQQLNHKEYIPVSPIKHSSQVVASQNEQANRTMQRFENTGVDEDDVAETNNESENVTLDEMDELSDHLGDSVSFGVSEQTSDMHIPSDVIDEVLNRRAKHKAVLRQQALSNMDVVMEQGASDSNGHATTHHRTPSETESHVNGNPSLQLSIDLSEGSPIFNDSVSFIDDDLIDRRDIPDCVGTVSSTSDGVYLRREVGKRYQDGTSVVISSGSDLQMDYVDAVERQSEMRILEPEKDGSGWSERRVLPQDSKYDTSKLSISPTNQSPDDSKAESASDGCLTVSLEDVMYMLSAFESEYELVEESSLDHVYVAVEITPHTDTIIRYVQQNGEFPTEDFAIEDIFSAVRQAIVYHIESESTSGIFKPDVQISSFKTISDIKSHTRPCLKEFVDVVLEHIKRIADMNKDYVSNVAHAYAICLAASCSREMSTTIEEILIKELKYTTTKAKPVTSALNSTHGVITNGVSSAPDVTSLDLAKVRKPQLVSRTLSLDLGSISSGESSSSSSFDSTRLTSPRQRLSVDVDRDDAAYTSSVRDEAGELSLQTDSAYKRMSASNHDSVSFGEDSDGDIEDLLGSSLDQPRSDRFDRQMKPSGSSSNRASNIAENPQPEAHNESITQNQISNDERVSGGRSLVSPLQSLSIKDKMLRPGFWEDSDSEGDLQLKSLETGVADNKQQNDNDDDFDFDFFQ